MTGISGCTDHNLVLQELLAYAGKENKTLIARFLTLLMPLAVSVMISLKSLWRVLISLPRLFPILLLFILSLIDSLFTKDWRSENFCFEKGVFQGDPSIPIIFLACFSPILQKLESLRLRKGFNHQGLHHITLPFADDSNLLTGRKITHQNIVKEIISWTTLIGLVLKPRKCKSLSIKAGCSAAEEFKLGDYTMASFRNDPYMKVLDGYITYKGKGEPSLIK
jgi:hypothetical protein